MTVGDINVLYRLDYFLGQPGQSGHELNSRAWFEPAPDCPFLIDDRIDATGLRVHDNDRAGMVAKSGDCRAADFQVFARRVIFGYVRHSLVAHRLLDGALSRDGSLTCKLRTPPCLCYFAPTLLCQTTRLGQALTL